MYICPHLLEKWMLRHQCCCYFSKNRFSQWFNVTKVQFLLFVRWKVNNNPITNFQVTFLTFFDSGQSRNFGQIRLLLFASGSPSVDWSDSVLDESEAPSSANGTSLSLSASVSEFESDSCKLSLELECSRLILALAVPALAVLVLATVSVLVLVPVLVLPAAMDAPLESVYLPRVHHSWCTFVCFGCSKSPHFLFKVTPHWLHVGFTYKTQKQF